MPILVKYRANAVHTCIRQAFKSVPKIILHASQERLLCTASFRINMHTIVIEVFLGVLKTIRLGSKVSLVSRVMYVLVDYYSVLIVVP